MQTERRQVCERSSFWGIGLSPHPPEIGTFRSSPAHADSALHTPAPEIGTFRSDPNPGID